MEKPALIHIELIDHNPYQPRQTEDPEVVKEIAESIRRNGLMQIPSARRVGGRYQLAFGHTRLAAFKQLGETNMPLIVRQLSDLQMFELGVAENIKRRDLNPIELAESMRRYMQEFEKNSVETGEFFNVSPEKVRNTVRLLNLPMTLQAGVADGSITQNNARRLLTIQRVAPDEVTHVANKLKGDADPDRIISASLKDTGRSVEMWQRWQSGEPRAGNRLWHLNMPADKFPQKRLPELRAAEVAKALGIEFTAEVRQQLESYLNAYIEQPAQLGGGRWFNHNGSHRVEGDVAEFLIAYGAPADVVEKIDLLLNPPACSACPLYAKVDGSHFCTFKLCHSRKTKAWEEHTIQTASKKLGIAIYNPKTDGQAAYLSSYDEPDKKLVRDRNTDLRIKKGTNWSQQFESLPEGYSIVLTGETLKKRMKTRKESDHRQSNEEYMAEQRRLREIRAANESAVYDFLWNVATPVFETLLNAVTNLDFLKEFSNRMVRGVPAKEPERKATKAIRMDFYRRALLFSLLDDDVWDACQKKKPVSAMAKQLQGKATAWGVKLPRNWMDQAVEADKAITVTAETEA